MWVIAQPLQKSTLNLFSLSLHRFSDQVPWLPRVVFQLSLECLWLPLTRASITPIYHENHLIWVDSSLMAPPHPSWASLVLSAFCCLSQGPASYPRTIWSEWTRSGWSPLACSKILLECLFRTLDKYYLLCIYSIFCIPAHFSFLFFIRSNLSVQMFVSVKFQFNSIVRLLSNHCLIIVQYSDPGNVFQVYRSPKEEPWPTTVNKSQWI